MYRKEIFSCLSLNSLPPHPNPHLKRQMELGGIDLVVVWKPGAVETLWNL